MQEPATVTPIHAQAEPAPDHAVRDEIGAVMVQDRSVTQAQLGREIGVSGSVVNQWLKGNYPGDNESVTSKVRMWLDARRDRQQASDRMPSAPAYVPTPISVKIIGALSYAQIAGDIACIYGGAGLGKTQSIEQYARVSLNVWHVTMKPSTSSVVPALEEICAVLQIAEQGGAAKLARAIVRRMRATGGLLVIDEAQHLSVAALDEIRSIHDAIGIGIAFVGNEKLYASMTGGNRAANLDRLHSRIGKRLSLTKATENDVVALIKAWGINDSRCRNTLLDIARKPGALRTLTKTLRLAAMYAMAEKQTVCCEHVGRAWRELGGAE